MGCARHGGEPHAGEDAYCLIEGDADCPGAAPSDQFLGLFWIVCTAPNFQSLFPEGCELKEPAMPQTSWSVKELPALFKEPPKDMAAAWRDAATHLETVGPRGLPELTPALTNFHDHYEGLTSTLSPEWHAMYDDNFLESTTFQGTTEQYNGTGCDIQSWMTVPSCAGSNEIQLASVENLVPGLLIIIAPEESDYTEGYEMAMKLYNSTDTEVKEPPGGCSKCDCGGGREVRTIVEITGTTVVLDRPFACYHCVGVYTLVVRPCAPVPAPAPAPVPGPVPEPPVLGPPPCANVLKHLSCDRPFRIRETEIANRGLSTAELKALILKLESEQLDIENDVHSAGAMREAREEVYVRRDMSEVQKEEAQAALAQSIRVELQALEAHAEAKEDLADARLELATAQGKEARGNMDNAKSGSEMTAAEEAMAQAAAAEAKAMEDKKAARSAEAKANADLQKAEAAMAHAEAAKAEAQKEAAQGTNMAGLAPAPASAARPPAGLVPAEVEATAPSPAVAS
jgi:hypothetical protein